MIVKRVMLSDVSKDLFDLEIRTMTRPFDLVSRNVEELSAFLKQSDIYASYEIGRIVGFVAYEKINNNLELKLIVVSPEYQSKGIGSELLNYCFKDNEGLNMTLTAHPDNSNALIFYLRNGLKITKWKDNCYGDGQPRLVLSKHI